MGLLVGFHVCIFYLQLVSLFTYESKFVFVDTVAGSELKLSLSDYLMARLG